MRKHLLCLFLLLAATAQAQTPAAATEKKYPSLLWEITGNGMTKPSYLYGTMHVSRKVAFHLSDSFFVAIKNVDIVSLELDMEQWMENNIDLDNAERLKEYTTGSNTPSGFYKKGLVPEVPSEDNLKSLLKSSPGIINHMLYRTSTSRSDYEENTYLDHFIFQAGRKLNKKLIGLEDFEKSERLSNKSSDPDNDEDEDAAKEEREQRRLLLKELRKDLSYSEAIEDAYRKGDLDLMDTMQKLNSSSKNFLKYMLYERNILMAERMDEIIRKTPMFTGVGAAHLPGPEGVIELLRKKGYKVRPVKFTGGNDIAQRSAIDAIRVPVKFGVQYAADSAFSAEFPGKLYETSAWANEKEYLHLDMANGAYYYIQRTNHYGGLKGQTPEQVLKRIDSLLYENIPGKIISRKTIKSNTGWPGFDIVNKTAKGDMQRYHIYVSPEEIFVFKMSGVEEYVTKGTEADRFFGSIAFRSKPQTNVLYTDAPLGVSIRFPGNCTNLRSQSSRALQRQYATGFAADGSYCMFGTASLYDFNYIEEDTFELNIIADVFAKQSGIKLLKKEVRTWQGRPALDASFEAEGKTTWARFVISGPFYYMALCRGEKATADAFLNSLALGAALAPKNTDTYTDTTLYFTVKTVVNNSRFSGIVNSASSPTPVKKDKKETELYLPINKAKYFINPETGERIAVRFRKFSMFYQVKDMDEFWNYRFDDLRDEKKLTWRQTEKKTEGPTTIIKGLVTDTGSTRAMMVKMIQRCGSIYTLTALIDSTTGPSPFVRNFFDSFQPKDTCIGRGVLEDKLSDYFFPNIYAADSTTRKRAEKAIDYVANNLQDVHLPKLMEVISDPRFAKLEREDKTELIRALGYKKNDQVMAYLEKLYVQYTDSQQFQFTILEAVARQKTVKSAKVFLKLLQSDLPVTSEEYLIRNAFRPFFDSLELAQQLFPAIMTYTRFDEYKSIIYELMADMLEKGKLRGKDYSKQSEAILEDAGYALKLYLSGLDRNTRYSYSSNPFSRNDYGRQSKIEFEPETILNNEQEDLLSYVKLLTPFAKNKRVSRFFDKVLSSTPADLRIVTAGELLRAKVPVNDTIWIYYASQRASSATVYGVLDYYKRLDKMPASAVQQDELVKSILFREESKPKGDTIVLLDKIQMKNKNAEGFVYFYKWRPKDKRIWKLACSGIHPTDQKQVTLFPDVNKSSIAFESEQQRKKETETLLVRIRIYGHPRASTSDFDTSTRSSSLYDWDF